MIASFPTIPTACVTQNFNNYNPTMYSGDGRHKGIDYGVSSGTPVYACLDGKVITAATQQTGYGRHVRIQHPDGAVSIYGHLTKILVSVGDAVTAGQEIGKSGGDPKDGIDGDGFSTGAHLHWEIRPPGKTSTDQGAVDPIEYCMRSLPATTQTAEVSEVSGLNVRAAPINGAVLYSVTRKQVLQIAEIVNGWARIHALRAEWCSAAYLFLTDPVVPPVAPELADSEKLARLWAAHPELA